jgi:hypothetical protein
LSRTRINWNEGDYPIGSLSLLQIMAVPLQAFSKALGSENATCFKKGKIILLPLNELPSPLSIAAGIGPIFQLGFC